MSAESSAATEMAQRELVVARVFDAPRTLVWKAWAEPERMIQWMGPRGFTGDIVRIDARPGGAYRFHLRGPAGEEHWLQGVYREIVEMQRLVYTFGWADAHGQPTRPETLVTVTFEDHGDKTRLTLRQATFESLAARDEHQGGWSSCFDCLAEFLSNAE